jgi:TolC family type I secretion outer membrane protein
VLASQKKLDAANARMGQAVGAFFPTIKADVQITTQATSDAALDARGWTLSLSQPLFVAALFPGYKIAQNSADLAKEELRKAAIDTYYNVTQAYFGVLKAEKFLKLSEQSREMAQSHLNQVNLMYKVGTVTRADILRTRMQLANSETAVIRARNILEIAKDAFNNVLGRKMGEKVEVAEETSLAISNLADYDALLATALKERPDWKEFNLAKNIAGENVSVAKSAYYPTVLLTGSTGNRVTEYSSYKTDVNSWAITGVASWTLFDGLGIQNRVAEAAANFEAQQATEEQVKSGIALEVREAYLSLKSGAETIESAKKAVESAEENYNVSELRYNSGVGTNLEVIDAQVALTQARVNYYQVIFDLEVAKAKLNKVIGKENI